MKARTKFLIAAFLLFLLLTASGLWYLQTDSLQELIRTNLVSQIERNSGLDCRIDGLELDIYRGNIRINGIALEARNKQSGLDALKIDEIRAKFSLSSFWHFRLRLGELHIVRPTVELRTGGKGGGWNPNDLLKTLSVSLSLETEKLTVQEGLFKINESSAPFNVSLNDLECRIGYSRARPSYRIELAYKQSRFFYKERDIIHDLKLTADLSIEGVDIENIEFRHGDSLLFGTGSVKNWDSPELLLHMTGTVRSRDMILADSSLTEGWGGIDVETDFRYSSEGIRLKGTFFLDRGTYRKMTYAGVTGAYEISGDVLYLQKVSGTIARGDFFLNGEIPLRDAIERPNRVTIESTKVPLYEIGGLLNFPSINFRNRVDAKTVLTWGHGRGTTVDCDAVLFGANETVAEGLIGTRLGGKVQFTYREDGGILLSSLDLKSSNTHVRADGGKNALFHVRLSTSRFSEPLDLIAHFSDPVSGLIEKYSDLRAIGGVYDFEGDVWIHSASDIGYEGSVSVKEGRWRTLGVDSMEAAVHLAGSRLDFTNLSLRSGLQSVQGKLLLDFADEENISVFGFEGNFQKINLSPLKNLGFTALDMEGVLNGSGRIRYEQSAWSGDGRLAIENGNFNGESFDRIITGVEVENRRVYLTNAEVWRGEVEARAEGEVDLETRSLDLKGSLHRLPLNDIPLLREKNIPIRGYADASGTISGTLENPSFYGTFALRSLHYDRWDLGRGEGELELGQDSVRGAVRIHSDFGDFSIQSRVSFAAGFPGTIAMDFDNLNIRKIVSDKAPPYLKLANTELEGNIAGEGNFDDWAGMKLHGEVDGARFKIQDYELHNSEEILFSIANKILHIENARVRGVGTDLFLSGSLPLDDGPGLNMDLNGSINLDILAGIGEELDTSGNAIVNIKAGGSRQDPQVIGSVRLLDAWLDYRDIPFPVSDIQGEIVLSTNIVRFENIRGNAASGSLQLSGTYEHRDMRMRSLNLGIGIRNARLPYPKGFRTVVDADLRLSGDNDLQILSGEIDVIRAEYVRDFNLLGGLTGGLGAQAGILEGMPYLQNLRLNVDIRSNDGLVIDNELTRVRGSLRLTLRGTPAYPSLTGRVESGEGTIFFRGNRFEISHAYADFVDRNRINPVLEIRAEADVKTYRLILDATGTLDNLALNITSDPPMSTVDILSLLTTGMAETGSVTTERETQMAGMSAASVLSENLTGAIGKRVQRIFGLESFRVDPFLAGAKNDPTARITVSERISRDLIVTYSRNLSTDEEQIIVLEYEVGKGLTVIATRDEDGELGLDFRFRKRFR
ncbi:MAG: translocation/assembly module TamB [Acidobacteria bacterium]|nr:translocation/assembly module TamB [Acidobacteriota bacterium]